MIYEAPTNVIATTTGLFARQQSTGDIYRHIGGSSPWVRVGLPGQAFLAIGSELYGLSPGGGNVYRYVSGTNWTLIPASARQILDCAGALCITDHNANILRYNGSGWTLIGGPGARFVSTNTQLFGLSPAANLVAMYSGSGTSWSTAGGEYNDLITTSNALYGLTTDRQALRVHNPNGVWDTVGGPGRQFHGSGGDLYATSPRGDLVLRRARSSWIVIGGPAARLYGKNGLLYATHPTTGVISSYSRPTNAWTPLGRP